MALPARARIAGILAICLLMLGAPSAMAGSEFQPDAQIRPGWNPSYTGDDIFYPTEQAARNTGVVGQKLTFFIKIENHGLVTGQFKVRRSSGFNPGYRVRYYDSAGHDVTWQVTLGTFTTPSLAFGGDYVMRATVKIRSLATQCSETTRLITVTSAAFGDARDAVRFTAALAGCPSLL